MTTLHTVSLTDHQKEVLVRVFTSATPELAKSEVEFGEKEIAAGEALKNMGAVEVTDTSARVTATGVDLMRQQGILDDDDQLTQEVEEFKAGDNVNVTDDVDIADQSDIADNFGSDFDNSGEEMGGPDDMSDDGDALASAGTGTDEDYGDFGNDMSESLIQNINNELKECLSTKVHKVKLKKAAKRQIAGRRRVFKKS